MAAGLRAAAVKRISMTLKKIPLSILGLVVLVLLTIAGKILFEREPLQPLEYKIYDYMSRMGRHKPGIPVAIVAIDDKSIRQIGSWPWPRSYIAEMIRRLSEQKAYTLGISLLYPSRELNPGLDEIQYLRSMLEHEPAKAGRKIIKELRALLAQAEKQLHHDRRLIAAVRSARRVVLPLRFTFDDPDAEKTPELSAWLTLNSIEVTPPKAVEDAQAFAVNRLQGILNNSQIAARQLIQPYNELSRKAGALGHINMVADHDGVVRRLPLLITFQGRSFPCLALQVTRKYRGVRLGNVRIERAGIQLGQQLIPTGKDHSLFINYSRPSVNVQLYSFVDVLNDTLPAGALRNKIVLLGVTADGLIPRYKTPLQASTSALEIEAQAVENIVNGTFISRPFWVFALEILALLYVGILCVFVLPRVNPRMAALILGIFLTAWCIAAVTLFLSNGVWLKFTTLVAIALVGWLLTSRHRRLLEKKAETVELNKSLGLALQGQGLLDMAFEKFMQCPIDDPSIRELMYNLGLDFERKRMSNKALAVYRHILTAGAFKDVAERIKKLAAFENEVGLSGGASNKKGSLLVPGSTTPPTLGRYEILRELGQGAMGTVYLGRDPSINREVAVKTINYADIEIEELDDVKSRFFREAEAAGKLSHPNIVTIYDVGEEHDMAYIAMELLRGSDLTHYCRRAKRLKTGQILNIIEQIAQALEYAHSREVVHRDIKPANIILQQDRQVKVADFGIARVMSASRTLTGIIFGTPNYMSPEQVAGKKVDGRSDLFSLGIVFYELLTGKRPFNGDSMTELLYAVSKAEYVPPLEIDPRMPPCCAEIIDRLLAKGVSKRYQTAAQVIKDVQQCRTTLE